MKPHARLTFHGRVVCTSAVALLAASMLLPAAPARAAGMTVAAGLVQISDDGQCSLREAVDNANDDAQTHADCPAGAGADVIALPGGTYEVGGPQRVGSGHPTSAFDITSDMSLVGAGTVGRVGDGPTILDAGGTIRHFEVHEGASLHLQDMRVEEGSAPEALYYECGQYCDGGAVRNFGHLSTQRVWFRGNEADKGGAVDTTGVFVAEATTLSDNTAQDAGGAIMNSGDLTIVGGTLSSNQAWFGAAIYNRSGAEALISDSVVAQNAADRGALDNVGGSLTVLASTVRDNSAAGIVNKNSCDSCWDESFATIADSTVSGNVGKQAGGVWNVTSGEGNVSMEIRQSTISDNSTYATGDNDGSTVGDQLVAGGVSSDNLADHGEGGNVDLKMTNVTLTGNWSPSGVQFRVSHDRKHDDATVHNTVIAAAPSNGENCAVATHWTEYEEWSDDFSSGSNWTAQNNLSDDWSCDDGGFSHVPDVLLQPLDDNGGPTRTHLPHPASPATDAGNQQFCHHLEAGRGAGRTPNDQRGPGFPRTVGAACDIGSVEGDVFGLTGVLVLDVTQLRFASSGSEGLRRSLTVKLDAAMDAIVREDDDAATGQLEAFANEVTAHRGEAIGEPDADRLLRGARTVVALIGSSSA